MAIQGIIRGFCGPQAFQKSVILFGRGDRYVLVQDGRVQGYALESLSQGVRALVSAMGCDRDHWVEVCSTAACNSGLTEVGRLAGDVNFGSVARYIESFIDEPCGDGVERRQHFVVEH